MTTKIKTKTKIEDIHHVEHLKNLIKVKEPYYALKNLHRNNKALVAEFNTELRDHDEVNSMSLAEIGRHLAILGSIAMADANPKKEQHYYLATNAEFTKVCKHPFSDTYLQASMQVTEFNRKSGIAVGYLMTLNGEKLFKASVKYLTISSTLFDRLFSNNKQLTRFDENNNPFHTSTPLHELNLQPSVSTAFVKKISTADCNGHFDDYPALPVARIGDALTTLAGMHFNEWLNKNKKYSFTKACIRADSFVFAGSELSISSSRIVENESPELGDLFQIVASAKTCMNAASLKCWIE